RRTSPRVSTTSAWWTSASRTRAGGHGSRTVGWTNVLTDGTFWARIAHGDRFSAAGAYSARVAGATSRRRPAGAIRIVKRRPPGQRTKGRPRVTLRIDVAAKRLVLGR